MKDARDMAARCTEIIALMDKVCAERLNDEYRNLAWEMVDALREEDPAILARGDPRIIACGVIYALGFVNFLFDPDNRPYLSVNDLCDAFGVKQASAYNKSHAIREALDLVQFHPDWCLPSQIDDNPLAWMVEVDGFYLDVRTLPRQTQEKLVDAGIIPHVTKLKSGDSRIYGKIGRSPDKPSHSDKGGVDRKSNPSQLGFGFNEVPENKNDRD